MKQERVLQKVRGACQEAEGGFVQSILCVSGVSSLGNGSVGVVLQHPHAPALAGCCSTSGVSSPAHAGGFSC